MIQPVFLCHLLSLSHPCTTNHVLKVGLRLTGKQLSPSPSCLLQAGNMGAAAKLPLLSNAHKTPHPPTPPSRCSLSAPMFPVCLTPISIVLAGAPTGQGTAHVLGSGPGRGGLPQPMEFARKMGGGPSSFCPDLSPPPPPSS